MQSNLSAGLFNAHPSPEAAKIIHRHFQSKVKASFDDLLVTAERGLSVDLSSVRAKLRALDESRMFEPDLYTAHAQLTDALRLSDVRSVVPLVESLAELDHADAYATPGAVTTLGERRSDHAMRLLPLRADGPRGRDGTLPEFYSLSESDLRVHGVRVKQALRVIAEYDHGMFGEVLEYLARLVLFSGKVVRGMTSVRAFGAVYLRLPEETLATEEQVAYYVDHLVHEVSHLALHGLMIEDPLILNADHERFDAPIRWDKRPMFGVYHATFVLGRICRILHRWSQDTAHVHLVNHAARAETMFRNGLATVSAHGKMTSLGRQVYESLEHMSRSLAKGKQVDSAPRDSSPKVWLAGDLDPKRGEA